MKTQDLFGAAVLAALCLPALAQNLKPGLWDVSNKMQSDSGEMEQAMAQARQQMATMPPEQRKAMEATMARQSVKIDAGGMSAKVCMTREMVERSEVPTQQGDCKTTRQQRVGNTMKMAFSCTNPPSKGEGQVVFVSPEAYTMKMAVTAAAQGKPEKINLEGSGRWLSSDCGNIKPLESGAKK